MFRLMRRTWRYLIAFLSGKLSEVADPRVLIEQAIDAAKRQHELLGQQAAAVIGNQRELEIKLARAQADADRLKDAAGQALVLAERSRRNGDSDKAESYEHTAQAFATRLVSVEASVESLRDLHAKAVLASAAAKRAVEHNAFALQQTVAERAKLLTQLEATKMQERVAGALRSMTAFAPASDTPTLADVRERIDARTARAMGAGEIASMSVDARMVEVEKAALDEEGVRRLEKIRSELRLGSEREAESSQDAQEDPDKKQSG